VYRVNLSMHTESYTNEDLKDGNFAVLFKSLKYLFCHVSAAWGNFY